MCGRERSKRPSTASEGSALWEVAAQTLTFPGGTHRSPSASPSVLWNQVKAEVKTVKACLEEASCAHDFFPFGLNLDLTHARQAF